jgi:hypothetical protein
MSTDLAIRYGVNPVNAAVDTAPSANDPTPDMPTLDVAFVWEETIDERVVGVYTGTVVLAAPRLYPEQYRITAILIDECVDETGTPELIAVPSDHRLYAPIALYLLTACRDNLDSCWADHLLDIDDAAEATRPPEPART